MDKRNIFLTKTDTRIWTESSDIFQ